MIRKLLFPALATALLGGCVSGYQYRGGYGDYYYGQPSVEYRDYGYGGFYGDPYGYYGGYPYSQFYGGYGYPYGWPYYPPYYPYRPPHRHHGGGHDHDDDGDDNDQTPDRPKPPWRDLGGLKPREPRPPAVPRHTPVMMPAPRDVETGRVEPPRRAFPATTAPRDVSRDVGQDRQDRDVRRKRTP